MKWTRLFCPLAAFDWHSAETAKLREALNGRMEKLLENRALIDERLELLESPVGEVPAKEVFQADRPAAKLFETLRTELAIRQDLARFFDLEKADRQVAHEQAVTAHQAKEKDVRKRLVKIGYVDGEPGCIGWIQPGFVSSHPEVRGARDLVQERGSDDNARRNENAACVEVITAALEEMRRKHVNV